MNIKNISEKIIPNQPGVYLFYNFKNQIIYIGKAKVLNNRIKSYLKEQKLDLKTRSMLKEAEKIDYIVTNSEKEALFLENNLIKKHKPKYNILLKDDKTFPYIKITLKEKYPRLLITRKAGKDGSKYFGPYLSRKKIINVLRMIEKIFPLRTCKSLPKRPCLNYHIKKCIGPCILDNIENEYKQMVKGVISFLSGKNNELLNNLKELMKEYSIKRQFEKAASIRDRIKSIEMMMEKQNVELLNVGDLDVISGYFEPKTIYIMIVNVRGGRITGWHGFFKKNNEYINMEAAIEGIILENYKNVENPPERILAEYEIPAKAILEEWLEEKYKKNITIKIPQNGTEKGLCDFVKKNIKLSLNKLSDKAIDKIEKALNDLKQTLSLKHQPELIFGFDVSNLGNANVVGSCVVFKNGKPFKKEYRHYNINIKGCKKDDYEALSEIVARKMIEVKNNKKEKPDLIILDGGKGHLNKVINRLKLINLYFMPVISIAKGPDIVYGDKKDKEINFNNFKDGRLFIKKIRDEAHRFAVNFQRNKRKESLKSALNNIHGLGRIRINMLMKHFQSLERIKKVNIKEIAEVKGIGLEYAKKIKGNIAG